MTLLMSNSIMPPQPALVGLGIKQPSAASTARTFPYDKWLNAGVTNVPTSKTGSSPDANQFLTGVRPTHQMLLDLGADTDGYMRVGVVSRNGAGSAITARVVKEGASSLTLGTSANVGSISSIYDLLPSRTNPRVCYLVGNANFIYKVEFPVTGTGAPTITASADLSASIGAMYFTGSLFWASEANDDYLFVFNKVNSSLNVYLGLIDLRSGTPTLVTAANGSTGTTSQVVGVGANFTGSTAYFLGKISGGNFVAAQFTYDIVTSSITYVGSSNGAITNVSPGASDATLAIGIKGNIFSVLSRWATNNGLIATVKADSVSLVNQSGALAFTGTTPPLGIGDSSGVSTLMGAASYIDPINPSLGKAVFVRNAAGAANPVVALNPRDDHVLAFSGILTTSTSLGYYYGVFCRDAAYEKLWLVSTSLSGSNDIYLLDASAL